MPDSKPGEQRIERYKLIFDYLKHLTTLSTGSIVIMATFLDKLLKAPEWPFLAIVSIIGFLIAVVFSVMTHTLFLVDLPVRAFPTKEWEKTLGGSFLFLTWFGFLLGVISLGVFAIKNLT